MLPLSACAPAQLVNGPRLRYEILSLLALACFEAQAEGAGRKKRNTDDVSKDRAILVPADSCARRVFGNENLRKPARRDACESFRDCAYPGKKVRHVLRSGQSAFVEIVPPSERTAARARTRTHKDAAIA